jgi:GTP1/Obg family GTP-binding protein
MGVSPSKKPKKRSKKIKNAKARQAARWDSDFDKILDSMIEENKSVEYLDPLWSNLINAVKKGDKTFECKECEQEEYDCEKKLRDHMSSKHGSKLLFHDFCEQT